MNINVIKDGLFEIERLSPLDRFQWYVDGMPAEGTNCTYCNDDNNTIYNCGPESSVYALFDLIPGSEIKCYVMYNGKEPIMSNSILIE